MDRVIVTRLEMSKSNRTVRLYCDAEDQGEVTPLAAVEALNGLDGKDRSEMSVETSAGEFIAGGGEDGEVSVSIYYSGSATRKIGQMINSDAKDETVVRTVGGQGCDINRRFLVPVSIAVEALEYFIEKGLPVPTVEWEKI